MIITLKAFRDLGRCSYGTLKETFDTERDVIYCNDEKVEVTRVEDLFPFLWQAPGVLGHTPEGAFARFHGTGAHWNWDYNPSIVRCKYDERKLEKSISKEKNIKKREKLQEKLLSIQEHRLRLEHIIKRNDEEMEEIQKKLIKENSK